jgi:hypothetical protein
MVALSSITLILFLFFVVSGVGWGLDISDATQALFTASGLVLAGWAALVLIVIAPYRLWKEKSDRVRVLTTPKLSVSPAEQVVLGDQVSIRFLVSSERAIPTSRCYGKLHNYRAITATQENQLPHNGWPLYWDWRTHRAATYATIGPMSGELLSFGILFLEKDPPRFHHMLAETVDGRRNVPDPNIWLTPGVFEFELEVGAQEEEFPPTRQKYSIVFHDDGKFELKEIKQLDLQT